MGEGTVRARKKYAQGDSEDDGSSDSDRDSDEDPARRKEEEALVESAMRRIRRAQAKGKQDVKLNKKELAALESRRKRLQAEASGEKKKKKKKEERYAVPLSQLGSMSQKESRAPKALEDALPRHPSPEVVSRSQGKAQPAVGYFAHPSSSRPSTADSRRAGQSSDRESSSSPFQYSYVQPSRSPPNSRHLSDPSLRPQSSRAPQPLEESRMLQYGASASVPSVSSTLDPFRFQTSGLQAPYQSGSAAALRSSAASSTYLEPSHTGGSSRRQSRQISPDATESEDDDDEEDEESDGVGASAHRRSSHIAPSDGREQILVELDRDPTPPTRPITRSSRKTSSRATSPKRKSASGGHSRRKRSSK